MILYKNIQLFMEYFLNNHNNQVQYCPIYKHHGKITEALAWFFSSIIYCTSVHYTYTQIVVQCKNP